MSQQPGSRYPIILASGSPRRQELLASLGVDFQVVKPDVDEAAFAISHLPPAEQVLFLSRTKAQEVFKHHTGSIVIGADTIVVLDGEVFGKPKDPEDAFRMLNALQGTMHEVYTGITIFHPAETPDLPPVLSEALSTRVFMRTLSPAEIKAYIQTGEPADKAGAYAIQGYGATLIERVEGCYFNVVGMSLFMLDRMFAQLAETLLMQNMPTPGIELECPR